MLPPVLPVVLYNGESAWTAAIDIKELVHQGLQQADEEQIFQWSERILTAKSLGDIFGH
jgi:hypothetical protein